MSLDPLDDLLAPCPAPPADSARRERHLATARGVLARRRWLGRLRIALPALAAIAVAWTLLRPAAPPPVPTRPEPLSPPEVAPPSPAEVPPTAVVLEMRAEQATDPATATVAFRLAGDRYADEADLTAALRCYRNHLDTAPTTELAVRPEDHWLLMTLKNAREKERTDANDRDSDGDDPRR